MLAMTEIIFVMSLRGTYVTKQSIMGKYFLTVSIKDLNQAFSFEYCNQVSGHFIGLPL